MTDEKPQIKTYGNNSKKAQEKAEVPEQRVTAAVVKSKVEARKPSLGKRMAASFTGDNAQTVGEYILFDIFIPAVKNFVADSVSKGIDRLMFGGERRTTSSSVGRTGHTSYNRMYREEDRRQLSDRGRRTHDFREIVIEDRADAIEVLDHLRELVDRYNNASVADLYDLCDISSTHADRRWGWKNLRDADVVLVRGGGYTLVLPETEELK